MSDVATPSHDLFSTLRSLPFVRGMNDGEVKLLAEISKEVEFPGGTLIFNESDPATHCYLILSGHVLLEICSPHKCTRILTIGPGDLLGWTPILGGARLSATARCEEPSRAIELEAAELIALCDKDPVFGYRLMQCVAQALSRRLTATRLQLLDLFRS